VAKRDPSLKKADTRTTSVSMANRRSVSHQHQSEIRSAMAVSRHPTLHEEANLPMESMKRIPAPPPMSEPLAWSTALNHPNHPKREFRVSSLPRAQAMAFLPVSR
jgi:hypothetical protein